MTAAWCMDEWSDKQLYTYVIEEIRRWMVGIYVNAQLHTA